MRIKSIPHILSAAVLGLLLAGFALAADPPSSGRLIRNIQKAYDDMESFSCTFRKEFQWALAGEVESTDGTMEIAGDKKFRFETPIQMMVTDGKTLWRYSVANQQVIIEPLDKAQGVLPKDFLFEYPKQFDAGDVIESVIDGQLAYMMKLEPKQPGLGVREVKVWVNAEDYITRRMEWTDDSGNRTTFIILDVQLNPTIPADRFVLDIPEGVQVFDLR